MSHSMPSFWTPWGTLITGEECWETAAAGSTSAVRPAIRAQESRSTAPAILDPVTPASNDGAEFVHQNVIPRTSHEGIQFDRLGNMYFIDELNGGNIYKYTPEAPVRRRSDWAGPTISPRVRPSCCASATATRRTRPAPTRGFRSRRQRRRTARGPDDHGRPGRHLGRCAQHHRPAGVQGHGLSAARRHADPERSVASEYLYVTTTTTNEVYRLDLRNKRISVFANRNTIDLATGAAVGPRSQAPTTSPSTTKATSTSSRTATAASTTTSGSRRI